MFFDLGRPWLLGLCLAAALVAMTCPPAFAADPPAVDADTLKHAATMAAFEKMAESNIELAKTLRVMVERGGLPAAAAIAQTPAPAGCQGIIGCGIAFLDGALDRGTRAVTAAGPIVQTIYAHKSATKQYEYQAVAAKEQTAQVVAQQATTQALGASIERAGVAGYQFVQAPGATTTTTLSGTGVIGGGTYTGPVTNTSTAPARVCTVSATGVQTCSGG